MYKRQPVPPVAPQPVAETETVAKETVAAKDLSLEAFAELPEVEGLLSNLVETLYNACLLYTSSAMPGTLLLTRTSSIFLTRTALLTS